MPTGNENKLVGANNKGTGGRPEPLIFPISLQEYNLVFLRFRAIDRWAEVDPKLKTPIKEREGATIFLPLTKNIPTSLKPIWKGPTAIVESMDDITRIASGAAVGVGSQFISNILGTVAGNLESGGAKIGDIVRDSIAARARRTVMPTKTQIFDGVNFRSFNFEFDLIPSNKDEANIIWEILNAFQKYSLPDLGGSSGDGRLLGTWPAEWDIDLFIGTDVSKTVGTEEVTFRRMQELMNFQQLVCDGVDINYGNNEGAMYYYKDGMPNKINLKLSFTETRFLTRNDFK